jgi:hypothetical protein
MQALSLPNVFSWMRRGAYTRDLVFTNLLGITKWLDHHPAQMAC